MEKPTLNTTGPNHAILESNKTKRGSGVQNPPGNIKANKGTKPATNVKSETSNVSSVRADQSRPARGENGNWWEFGQSDFSWMGNYSIGIMRAV